MRRVVRWAGAAVSGALLVGAPSAHPPTEPLKPGGHPTGHVGDKPEGMTWPPQPPGITKVQDLSDVSAESRRRVEREFRFSNLEQRFAGVEALKPLVGRRMTRLSIEEIPDKTPSAKIE